jgi:excisionase family DNA binding protein
MSARRTVPRLALSPEEAAESLGMSRSHFYEHVFGDLRIVRVGQRRLVPVAELEQWLHREAMRLLGEA